MMHKEYSFNSDTWMLGCVFSVIASAARVSCFDFPKDPKFAHITERQRYGSPYSELIVRKVAHRPPGITRNAAHAPLPPIPRRKSLTPRACTGGPARVSATP